VRVSDISTVEHLNPDDTGLFFEALMQEQHSFADTADIVGYVRMLKKESPSFKYFTLSPRATVSSVGPKERITALNVSSGGGMIVVCLKNNEFLYLTPANPEGFKAAIDRTL
jgi:hypothetical protein